MLGTPCMYNFLWKAIQPGEMFGFWDKVWNWLYSKGYKNIANFLGGCEVCFSHCISWVSLIMFCALASPIWVFAWYETVLIVLFPLFINWFTGLWMKQAMDIRAAKREKLELEVEELKKINKL